MFVKVISRFWDYMRNHTIAIILAFLLAVSVFVPLIVFPFVAGKSYHGMNIPYHGGTDFNYYLNRAKEVLEGRDLGNMILRDGKDNPDTTFAYGEKILFSPYHFLGVANYIDTITLCNIYDFVGIFILILLIYHLVLQLSADDKRLSIITALFVIGGYSLVYNKSLFFTDFNIYGRPTIPYVSSLAFFIYLNFLAKAVKLLKWRYWIMVGASFGLLFYILLYAWSYVLVLNGILFVLFLLKKDFIISRRLFVASVIGLTLGSYNVIKILMFYNTEVGERVSFFFYASHSHQAVFSKIGLIALILITIYCYYKKKIDEQALLFIGFALSGWVALNQQIITGKEIQYGHFYWYFIVPTSIITMFYILWYFLNQKLRRLFFIAVILVVFFNTIIGQYDSMLGIVEQKTYIQNYKTILDVLDKDKDSKVILATNDNLAQVFTIYTNHDLFWLDTAVFYSAPIERIEESLLVYLYLNKESRGDIEKYLNDLAINKDSVSYYQSTYRKIESFSSGYDWYQYFSKLSNNAPELLSNRQVIIKRLTERCRQEFSRPDLILNLLRERGVKYVVWDKNKNPEWDLSFMMPKLKELVEYNNIYLYQIDW